MGFTTEKSINFKRQKPYTTTTKLKYNPIVRYITCTCLQTERTVPLLGAGDGAAQAQCGCVHSTVRCACALDRDGKLVIVRARAP